ncbi:MAG: N-formylglutamate amidohydrolase [Gammaproteobacteria bacterium]
MPPLLTSHDPPPFAAHNPNGGAPVLLVCDHASWRVPSALVNLGLAPELLASNHIAWDIGAACVTRGLAERLNAPALLTGYSRLVIDCNRQPGDPTSIPALSDGVIIPANQNLGDADAEQRVQTFFWPYHHTITETVARLWRHGPPPALVSIHSFTPVYRGLQRPWHIGVLWNHDPRMVAPFMHWLAARHPDLCVGDNEPYSGRAVGFTIDRHAGAAGLPHITLEIRQDLIADQAGCRRWTDIVGAALEAVLANESLHRVEHF